MCDTPAEKYWQLSKWLLKQSVINIHSSLQNNFLVRHWPVALVGREGRKKISVLTDFIFLTDITGLLIFSFPAMVPRPVYNPSDHPNTCVYVWNITLDFCTSVPPHSTTPPPPHWWENGLLLLYARVELIFMTTNSPQLNVRNDWVFFYFSQIRAIKWIIA